MSQVKAPIPQPNETHEQYCVRAHKLLLPMVPDPEQRNTMVWSAWQHSRGLTSAEQRARQEFASDRYVPSPNHCYFVEHETIDSQGQPIQFTLGDLVEIARNCNKRASDRKAFAAISDNHTSPTDQSHRGDPPVLGAVGNYKIGMIGYDEPKFAIFADEYHKAEKAHVLKDKPRRSVELVTFHNTGERFIDPVAALGGRAPRLAMPTRYSVASYSSDGSLVSRYQCEGPSMVPGPSNTHIKSTDYFSDTPTDESSNMAIDDETISQIVNAISNMPEFAWVREQMDAQNGGAVSQDAPGGMDDVGGPNFGPGAGDPEGSLDDDLDVDRNAAFQGGASGHNVVTPPSEDSIYEDQQRYSAANNYEGRMNQFVEVSRYNALVESHKNLLNQFGAVATKMKSLEQGEIDARRRARIQSICQEYPGIYDSEEECNRLLYSAGASVSDEVFNAEIQRMQALASRVSIQQNSIPRGTVYRSNEGAKIERNAAWYQKCQEIQEAAANRDEFLSYDELAEAADKAMAGK